MNRRTLLATAIFCGILAPRSPLLAAAPRLRLVKDPNCGCCEGHAAYLEQNGFEVTIEESSDLNSVRRQEGIPDQLAGCHTIFVDGYIVEGHVPAAAIRKLLNERPAIRGISLPGMPPGSPGMNGEKEGALVVLEIGQSTMPRPYWTE
ncbi:MAG: DUF411 domain-containing protein [Rhodospirillaceae bacterium]|nr:DUF411 domain-containing protein [Rhodospirillaceae bacterium]